jgi:hypothetical protein
MDIVFREGHNCSRLKGEAMGRWSWLALAALTLIVVVCIVFFWRAPVIRLLAWALTIGASLCVIKTMAGDGRFMRALLVDERNRFSLPQLFTFAWFMAVVPAALAMGIWNLPLWAPAGDSALPLLVAVPETIWALAGIVATAQIGTAVTNAEKRTRVAKNATARAMAATPQADGAQAEGALYVRQAPDRALPVDFVAHDEIGIEEKVDLGAVQQLLFQLAAWIIYVVALIRLMLVTPADVPVDQFPGIHEGFLGLLGVSTLGALANRAVPR